VCRRTPRCPKERDVSAAFPSSRRPCSMSTRLMSAWSQGSSLPNAQAGRVTWVKLPRPLDIHEGGDHHRHRLVPDCLTQNRVPREPTDSSSAPSGVPGAGYAASMSATTTADVASAAADTVICSACQTSVPRPPAGRWARLWDAGWRWIGTWNLYSCPDCPQVIVVDEQGRHTLGPGAARAEATRPAPLL
jgi:hypothetical protein